MIRLKVHSVGSLSTGFKVAIAKRAADLLGLEFDASRLLELSAISEQMKEGDSIETVISTPEVQNLLGSVITPKALPEPVASVARCPHCERTFAMDPSRIQ
jgi:hypothetical protein